MTKPLGSILVRVLAFDGDSTITRLSLAVTFSVGFALLASAAFLVVLALVVEVFLVPVFFAAVGIFLVFLEVFFKDDTLYI